MREMRDVVIVQLGNTGDNLLYPRNTAASNWFKSYFGRASWFGNAVFVTKENLDYWISEMYQDGFLTTTKVIK